MSDAETEAWERLQPMISQAMFDEIDGIRIRLGKTQDGIRRAFAKLAFETKDAPEHQISEVGPKNASYKVSSSFWSRTARYRSEKRLGNKKQAGYYFLAQGLSIYRADPQKAEEKLRSYQ